MRTHAKRSVSSSLKYAKQRPPCPQSTKGRLLACPGGHLCRGGIEGRAGWQAHPGGDWDDAAAASERQVWAGGGGRGGRHWHCAGRRRRRQQHLGLHHYHPLLRPLLHSPRHQLPVSPLTSDGICAPCVLTALRQVLYENVAVVSPASDLLRVAAVIVSVCWAHTGDANTPVVIHMPLALNNKSRPKMTE